MDAIGEHHNSMIQQWQRMTNQHPEGHYGGGQHLMLHHQGSLDTQNSPINGTVDGGFTYSTTQNDG